MDYFFDETARILATPIPRRKAFRLIASALAAAVVAAFSVQPASAVTCTGGTPQTCGRGMGQICCAATQCCAAAGAAKAACCNKGQCTCSNGTCAASSGGACPGGCSFC